MLNATPGAALMQWGNMVKITGYPVVMDDVQAIAVMTAVRMTMVACGNMVVKYSILWCISKSLSNNIFEKIFVLIDFCEIQLMFIHPGT